MLSGTRLFELPQGAGVYFIRSATFDLTKIGCSRCLSERLDALQTGFPERLEYLFLIETGDYAKTEKWFHREFHDKRIRYEWFQLWPEEILSAIKRWERKKLTVYKFTDLRAHQWLSGLSARARSVIADKGGLEAIAAMGEFDFGRSGIGAGVFNEISTALAKYGLAWRSPEQAAYRRIVGQGQW